MRIEWFRKESKRDVADLEARLNAETLAHQVHQAAAAAAAAAAKTATEAAEETAATEAAQKTAAVASRDMLAEIAFGPAATLEWDSNKTRWMKNRRKMERLHLFGVIDGMGRKWTLRPPKAGEEDDFASVTLPDHLIDSLLGEHELSSYGYAVAKCRHRKSPDSCECSMIHADAS